MRLRDNHSAVRRLCADALLTASALLLSYLETLLPVQLLIPLPGIRLGLANLAVMLTFFIVSPLDAAAVSAVRITLMALLFGSPVSFMFSLFGALLSYAGMFLFRLFSSRGVISFIGISVGCAVLHGIGQTLAAAVIYTPAAFSYLPVLITAGTATGCITGIVANIIYKRTRRLVNGID